MYKNVGFAGQIKIFRGPYVVHSCLQQWFSTGVPRNPWVLWKALGVPQFSELDVYFLVTKKIWETLLYAIYQKSSVTLLEQKLLIKCWWNWPVIVILTHSEKMSKGKKCKNQERCSFENTVKNAIQAAFVICWVTFLKIFPTGLPVILSLRLFVIGVL